MQATHPCTFASVPDPNPQPRSPLPRLSTAMSDDEEHDELDSSVQALSRKSGVGNLLSKLTGLKPSEKKPGLGCLTLADPCAKAKRIDDGCVIASFMDPCNPECCKDIISRLPKAVEQETVDGVSHWIILGSHQRVRLLNEFKKMAFYPEQLRTSYTMVVHKYLLKNIKRTLEYIKVNPKSLQNTADFARFNALQKKLVDIKSISSYEAKKSPQDTRSIVLNPSAQAHLMEAHPLLLTPDFHAALLRSVRDPDAPVVLEFLKSLPRILHPSYVPSESDIRSIPPNSTSPSKFWTAAFNSSCRKYRVLDMGSIESNTFSLISKLRKTAQMIIFYVDLMDYTRTTGGRNTLELIFDVFEHLCCVHKVTSLKQFTLAASVSPLPSPTTPPSMERTSQIKYRTLPPIMIVLDSVEKVECHLQSRPFRSAFPDFMGPREDINSVLSFVEARFVVISKNDSMFRQVKHDLHFVRTSELSVSSPLYSASSEEQMLYESLRSHIIDKSQIIS